MKSNSNTRRRDTPKVRKPELSFLYTTRHLTLFYISNKYHQNIPKGICVTERTGNSYTRRGDNSKSKTAKMVIFVCDRSSGPVLHFYKV